MYETLDSYLLFSHKVRSLQCLLVCKGHEKTRVFYPIQFLTRALTVTKLTQSFGTTKNNTHECQPDVTKCCAPLKYAKEMRGLTSSYRGEGTDKQ